MHKVRYDYFQQPVSNTRFYKSDIHGSVFREKYFGTPDLNTVGSNMRILLGVIVLITFAIARGDVSNGARLPVQRPEHSLEQNKENANDLLTTLLELHQSLIKQIALLENMQKSSDMDHLILHYTAQKDNIEREIALIKSIEVNTSEGSGPRHIFKNILPEEPVFKTIFKKTRNPSSVEQMNDDTAGYAVPYPPYYIAGQDPQYIYPYPGSYPNDLIVNTYPGNKPQRLQDAQMSPNAQPTLEVPSQFAPLPQVTIKAQVPPSDQQQNKPQLNIDLPNESQPQKKEGSQSEKDPELPESQFGQKQGVKDTQLPPYGQKQGVYVYYPDGIIPQEEDIRQRPTLADRFGQVFDRFGQVISNIANRQPLRPTFGANAANMTQKMDTLPAQSRLRNRGSTNYQRSSSDRTEKVTARKAENKRQKLRWVSA